MPGLFHSNNEKQLQDRINAVNREIGSLIKFRTKIENRIQHLRNRADNVPTNKEAFVSFKEWLDDNKGFGFRCRYERIQQFVGPELYPRVKEFLETAYLTGYQAGIDSKTVKRDHLD